MGKALFSAVAPLLGWNNLFLMFRVTDSLSQPTAASSLKEGAKLSPIA